MFVKRSVRTTAGPSMGTLKVTVFPATRPGKTFGCPALPSYVPAPVPLPVIAHMPDGSAHASCVWEVPGTPLPGSSTMTSASENPLEYTRLVTAVFMKNEIWAWGTGVPKAVGMPPVQIRVMSPTSSVKPSARKVGVTATFVWHCKGLLIAAAGAIRAVNRKVRNMSFLTITLTVPWYYLAVNPLLLPALSRGWKLHGRSCRSSRPDPAP
jgi:hypothetical protein